jgi:hypothetical protein
VVSPQRLLNQEELAYFDYFAHRASDPEGQEVNDFTFQKMTGAVLDTRIIPIDGEPLAPSAFRVPSYSGRDVGSVVLLDSEIPITLNRQNRFDIRGSFDRDYVTRNRPLGIRVQIASGATILFTSAVAPLNSSGAFLVSADLRDVAPGNSYSLVFQAEYPVAAGMFYPTVGTLSVRVR